MSWRTLVKPSALITTVLRVIVSRVFDPILGNRDGKRARTAFQEEQRRRVADGEIPPVFRTYDDYMASAWWQMLRGHTLEYLGNRCEFCGGAATQVHHVRYPRPSGLGYESIKSLYAVCSRCHQVAHGQDSAASTKECAFCFRAAKVLLNVELKHYSNEQQHVCQRCEALATGYRSKAHNWSKDFYTEWVSRWRETIPTLRPGMERARTESLDAELESERLQAEVHQASLELAELDEFREHLLGLSKDELESMWANSSDLSEDQRMVLRFALRRALGITPLDASSM